MTDTISNLSGSPAASSTQQLVIQFAPRVCEVPLTQGHVALVDEADFDRVMQFKWHARQDHRSLYAVRKPYPNGRHGRRAVITLHRFILNPPAGVLVDHIDHDGLNNSRQNLRLATPAQNCQNRRDPQNKQSFKFRGVHASGPRWRAVIYANNRYFGIGTFGSPEDAARAYNAKARELHGEFAYLNAVPEERQ